MQQIYHKKNEFFEVEFYKDKEYTETFDFTNAKNLYIELKDADIMPLCYLHYLIMDIPHSFARNDVVPKKPSLGNTINIYTPYIPSFFDTRPRKANLGCVKTLNDITPNLSKYIPEDNAVLFLMQEDTLKYSEIFKDHTCAMLNKVTLDIIKEKNIKKLTIFLSHGTQSELQKANEIAKELKEKYGVEEVNLFVLHWFGSEYQENDFEIEYLCKDFGVLSNFNKVITTNSTGILPVQDNERLQVIDCKEIFEEYLKENN